MRLLLCAAVVAALTGCSDSDVGPLYRAERDLWRAERRMDQLASRERSGDSAWEDLANGFEALARRYLPEAGVDSENGLQLERIVATAWFHAATIYAAQVDSERAETTLHKVLANFPRRYVVRGDAALRLGNMAESRGDYLEAVEYYQRVVDMVPPDPEKDTVESAVLELPLRIARLSAKATDDAKGAMWYGEARAYYLGKLASGSLPVQVEAQRLLAEVAADQHEWGEAMEQLQSLERQLREMDSPPRAPGEIRFASVRAQIRALTRGETDLETVRASVDSMMEDYPLDSRTPQALLLMAQSARDRRQPAEALGYIKRIRHEFGTSNALPEATLLEAELLEATGRWSDALQVLRSLPTEFPTSPFALRAHLRVASHYLRMGPEDAASTALEQAERFYRNYIGRFPEGEYTFFAYEELVTTLKLQDRPQEALETLLALCARLAGTAREPVLLVEAAQMAREDLQDLPRAISILERLAARYSHTRLGAWASREAERLRPAIAP